MSRYANGLLGVLVVCVVGFVLGIATHAFAQSPSSTSALPVKVTNTPTVTVNNPATNPVPVAGTVQVSGTPTVELAGTPTVALTGTPSVLIANPPSAGLVYAEVLGVTIDVNGGVAGEPGFAVPTGYRRIVTTVSARWFCDTGHRALLQIFGNTGLFLPGQFAYTDAMNRDTYAMVTPVNIVQTAGTRWVPIIESDGAYCFADIFLSGMYVRETP
jgi:hypothetical protein